MTMVEVRGRYIDVLGGPASGHVTFTARPDVTYDSATKAFIIGQSRTAVLDGDGAFAVELQATDDPELDPVTWTYQVREWVGNAWLRPGFDTPVPAAAVEDGIELGDVAPATPASGVATSFPTLTAFTAVEARVDDLEEAAAAGQVNSVDGRAGVVSLADLYAKRNQAREEIWDRFADHADGVPAAALTGQPYLNYGTPGFLPTVADGKLTLPANPANPAELDAMYAQVLLDAPTKRIGARWTFGPESTPNGEAVLIAWSTNVQVAAIGDSSCHLELGPRGWSYSVYVAGVFTNVASGAFSPALATDDTTVHTCEVVLDTANAIAYLHLPDGLTKTVTHPMIATADAVYAAWESICRDTDTHAAFAEVWADSRDSSAVLPAKTSVWAKPPGQYVYYAAGGPTPVDAPTAGLADIDPVNLKITMPARGPTGRQRVTLNGFLDMTGPTQVLWAIATGGAAIAVVTVANGQVKARVSAEIIGAFTEGAVYTWMHWGVGVGGNLNLYGAAGYVASMTAEPI